MKGLVAATAVLGVVAIAGLPALALTLASDETRPGSDETAQVQDGPPGPPPWARARGHEQDKDQGKDPDKDQDKESGEKTKGPKDGPGARWSDGVPPGWAKAQGHKAGRTPHGWAMRDWAHCVAGAAKPEGETFDPEAACGTRPTPPGRLAR